MSIGLARNCITTERQRNRRRRKCSTQKIGLEERTMWTKPDFTEMRFGFEITMYIGNR